MESVKEIDLRFNLITDIPESLKDRLKIKEIKLYNISKIARSEYNTVFNPNEIPSLIQSKSFKSIEIVVRRKDTKTLKIKL